MEISFCEAIASDFRLLFAGLDAAVRGFGGGLDFLLFLFDAKVVSLSLAVGRARLRLVLTILLVCSCAAESGLSLSLSLSAGVKERGRCFSSSDSREERSLESVSDDKSDSDRPGEVHMPG